VDPVDESTIEEKHASPGLETEEHRTEHSLFEVNGYKNCLKRLENGDKIIEQLIAFLESRAEVEDIYAKRLHEWDEKMKLKIVPKCDQFAQSVLLEITPEANINYELHKEARERLRSDIEALKTWRKTNYPKKTFGGLKETENLEKQFKEVTSPYVKALHDVELTKKRYHEALNRLTLAQAKVDTDSANEQLIAESRAAQSALDLAKIEYENTINAIANIYPTYEDKMRQLFNQIQDIEKKRMNYIKEIARRYVTAVNLTETDNLEKEYERVKAKIENFSPDELLAKETEILLSLNDKLPVMEEIKPIVTEQYTALETGE